MLEGGDVGERDGKGLEIAGVAGVLGEAGGGALDIADAFEGLAAFGKEVGFCEKCGDDVLAGSECFQIPQRVEDPIAKEACAHGGGGAIEHAEQGVLFTRARIDEIEIALGGGIDEDMVGIFPDSWGAEVGAIPAELVDEVVHRSPGGTAGGVEVCTPEAV